MAKMVRHTSEELKAMRDRGESKTDWERVKRDIATDAPIHYDPAVDPYDPNDDAAVETYWSQATIIRRGRPTGAVQKQPVKKQLAIRLSAEVVEYFKATGKGWQGRIDDILKNYTKKHPVNHA